MTEITNPDQITPEYIAENYAKTEIMEHGRRVAQGRQYPIRRTAHLSMHDFPKHLQGPPEEVKERVWGALQERIDMAVGLERDKNRAKPYDYDNYTLDITYDDMSETLDIEVIIPIHGSLFDDDRLRKFGIDYLINQETVALKKRIDKKKKVERQKKRDESDLKRLISKNPELAKKLLTDDNS